MAAVNHRTWNPDARDPRLSIFGLDIAASNGVIHTIDRVLRPVDL